MAIDFTSLPAPLEHLLGYAQRERHHKDKMTEKHAVQRREALEAIYLAICETRKYQEFSGRNRDREKEYELAKLWSLASIKSQGYLGDFTLLSYDKAMYWTSQLKWPQEKIFAKRIDLESIESKYRSLLENG